jgi:hypothetical protein
MRSLQFQGPRKSRFQGQPFKRPALWISPHPNQYFPPHINTGTLIVKVFGYNSGQEEAFTKKNVGIVTLQWQKGDLNSEPSVISDLGVNGVNTIPARDTYSVGI